MSDEQANTENLPIEIDVYHADEGNSRVTMVLKF